MFRVFPTNTFEDTGKKTIFEDKNKTPFVFNFISFLTIQFKYIFVNYGKYNEQSVTI